MADSADEEWRPIPGYDGFYSVSSLGRIRCEARVMTRKNGSPLRIRERLVKLGPDSKGYLRFNAGREGASKILWVHHCVLAAFVGPKPIGQERRHLDGRRQNNRLENLAYGTRSVNIADAKAHGTFPQYERRPGAKLTRVMAQAIAQSDKTAAALADEYHVGGGAIQAIRDGRAWAGVVERRGSYIRHGELCSWARLTESDVRFILQSADTARALARRFGVHADTIKAIRRGRTWKRISRQQINCGDPSPGSPDTMIGGASDASAVRKANLNNG